MVLLKECWKWGCPLLFVAVLIALYCPRKVDGSCTFPSDLAGEWTDSVKGSLYFNQTTGQITGYEFGSFGYLTLTCWMLNDTVYIFESSEFEFFSLNFTAYFCWNFTQVNSDLFYFYEYGNELPGADNERVQVYLPAFTRVYDVMCANPDIGLGTYRVLYRNNSLTSSISNCPTELQAHWNYTVANASSTDLCANDVNQLDLCTDPTKFDYNSSECSISPGYTENGTVNCLFHVYDSYSDIFYLALAQNGGADGTSTFPITCMIVSFGNPSYLMGTQYPTQCPATQNDSYVESPGAYVSFIKTGSCSSEFPWWIIAVSVGSFLFLLLLIAFIIWFCCYRESDEEKKKRLMDEEEDERFNPDLFSRGDRPPYVSISIMDGWRPTSADLDYGGEGGGLVGPDDVDGDREKALADARKKKEEAQKRRLDKRKRVFVIDKDGQVKKMWKEERDSPDSGLEEDQLDGDGKSPEKGSSTNEDEEAEFAKKHGRKSLKSAQEIQEKGDRRPSQDKTRGKMSGMVSAKRSAQLRQSARSGPSKLKSERSWGSSNGDFEVVNFQEEDEEVFAAAVGTTAAVAVVSEVEAKKESKGGKGKKSKEKTATEQAQTSSKVAESTDDKANDGAQDETTNKEKDLKKSAAAGGATVAGGAAAAGGAVATKKAQVPKAGDQKKKPQVAQKAQTSKLKKKAPQKKDDSQAAAEKQDDKVLAQSEGKSNEEMQDSVKTEAVKTGDGEVGAAEVAAVAAPAAAVTTVVPAGAVAAARVDHKQKDKAELRRLMVEKKQKEKDEKLKEKERLRVEKEEKLKKQKEEKEAKMKKEREEKKKAPIKKKYLSETTEAPQDEEDKVVEKETEVKVKSLTKEIPSTSKPVPGPEIAVTAAAAAVVAPVAVVAAVKRSKKSKETIEEEHPGHKEDEDPSKPKSDQHLTPANESELKEDDEKSEKQESSMSTATTDSDSGRSSVKSLDSSQSDTVSSTSAPEPVAEQPQLPDGMTMRREQSIMLDLDRTKSQLADAPLRRENSDLATPVPGQSKRALGAVAEMIETARSQVEGRGLTEDDQEVDVSSGVREDVEGKASIHQAQSVSMAGVAVHPGLKEKESSLKQDKTKSTKDVNSQTTSEKQGSQETKPAQVKQISVSEAKSSAVPASMFPIESESEDSSSEESEEEEVLPAKKRAKPAGFMFPNENMAAQTFKTTGEVINAKPKKARKKRRLPRKTSVDFLPDRTNLAFGLKPTQGKPGAKPGKVVPVIEKDSSQTKKGVPKLLSVKELPAVRASAAPITIKDLTKKPPAVPALQVPGIHTLGVAGDGQNGSASPSTRKGRSESSSPARRTPLSSRRISEADSHSQLKLMTRLMSQSEMISEVEPSPRHSLGSRRSGKTRSDQLSRHSDPPPPRGLALSGLDEMDGVQSVTNASSTPDELKTGREGDVLVGRPPTQHNYRRPSREESPKRSHAVSRSHSDSRRGPPPLSHQTQDSDETRFVKFREGVMQQLGDMDQQELNRILYPGIKRYPDTPEHLRRGTAAYKSLNALQRIHRKKYRQVAPHPKVELPPIMNAYRGNEVADQDDPRMRNWLEELYSDKKFFDKSLALQEDDEFIQNRTEDGRNYLMNRARFWSTQQPLVRPGTKMGNRGLNGAPDTETGGGSTPGLIHNTRSKSDERQKDWKFH